MIEERGIRCHVVEEETGESGELVEAPDLLLHDRRRIVNALGRPVESLLADPEHEAAAIVQEDWALRRVPAFAGFLSRRGTGSRAPRSRRSVSGRGGARGRDGLVPRRRSSGRSRPFASVAARSRAPGLRPNPGGRHRLEDLARALRSLELLGSEQTLERIRRGAAGSSA